MAGDHSGNGRLAKRVLAILLRRAVESVPVVGRALATGVDVADAIRQEVADEQQVSREDVVRLLNMLDQRAR